VIKIARLTASLHMREDDMPCSVYAVKHGTQSAEPSFHFRLGTVDVWMSREQVDQLRKVLKPSKLDEMDDEAHIVS
jgi:hypothetical protein